MLNSSHYTVVVNPTSGVASGNVALSLVAGGATDTAGNPAVAANLSGLDSQGIDTLKPAAPTVVLHTDSGISSSDKITNIGQVDVGGLESGVTWQYSVDNGAHWNDRQRQ